LESTARLIWISDIHFEHLEAEQITQFLEETAKWESDLVLIGGDITLAAHHYQHLKQIESVLNRPIYFVMGNHDYYGGSIDQVRSGVQKIEEISTHLTWLPDAGVVSLTDKTALIGHGCWADGRAGDFHLRPELMTDYFAIEEFRGLDDSTRLKKLKELGTEAAGHLENCLGQALYTHDEVLILTHVPPFAESCFYRGKRATDDILPHFVCQAAGQAIQGIIRKTPDKQVTVLSGHTHSASEVDILPNLKVITAETEYGLPAIQSIIEIH